MNESDLKKLGLEIMQKFHNDPFGYCQAVLGYVPDEWQRGVMESVRDYPFTAVRSGNGPGKTRLDASVIHWFAATRPYPQIVATAGRFSQLKDKLWRELAKVNEGAINKELFEWRQESFRLKAKPELWFASAVPWSKHNPESFAGTHEEHVLMLFDEASSVDDSIFEAALGAMTTHGARWLCTGNPTRNKGKFFEAFGRGAWKPDLDVKVGWHGFTVSSFDSPRHMKAGGQILVDQIIQEYGKDSDYFRVHVLGLPPRAEDLQFIPDDLFEGAITRINLQSATAPRIMGVDVAYTGGDRTVISERRGLLAKHLLTRRGQDTMATVGDVISLANQARAEGDPYDYIVVDVIGIGAGVVDRLKEQNFNVIGVNVGTTSRVPEKYKNLRAELWDAYKQWLREGTIPLDYQEDSCGIQYQYDSAGRLQMERKEHMKDRELNSPDMADSIVMTFYIQNAIRQSSVSYRPKNPTAPGGGRGWRR